MHYITLRSRTSGRGRLQARGRIWNSHCIHTHTRNTVARGRFGVRVRTIGASPAGGSQTLRRGLQKRAAEHCAALFGSLSLSGPSACTPTRLREGLH